MCECGCVYVAVPMHTRMHARMYGHVWLCVCMGDFVYIYIYMCSYVGAIVNAYVCVYMNVSICACTYVCIHVCMCGHIYLRRSVVCTYVYVEMEGVVCTADMWSCESIHVTHMYLHPHSEATLLWLPDLCVNMLRCMHMRVHTNLWVCPRLYICVREAFS